MTKREELKYILRYWPARIIILYSLLDGIYSIDRAFIIENIRGTVVVKRKHANIIKNPKVIVYHPGFVYWRGVFEGLYYTYIHEGLPNEKESLRFLRKYLKWIDGYEVVSGTLHVRTVSGRRIPIYDLSDGQRVAVFMGLLYAITKPPVLLLIDTPEVFVHPDGLPTIASIIASLVAEGNQVLIATQSTEFLEELLIKAKQYEVLDYTSVQRIALTKDGTIKAVGKWSGETSLRSIEELGADLRR